MQGEKSCEERLLPFVFTACLKRYGSTQRNKQFCSSSPHNNQFKKFAEDIFQIETFASGKWEVAVQSAYLFMPKCCAGFSQSGTFAMFSVIVTRLVSTSEGALQQREQIGNEGKVLAPSFMIM